MGNRRRVKSYYHDGNHSGTATQDYWYRYDKLNRFVVTKGTFSNYSGSEPVRGGGSISHGTKGYTIGYNAIGQRITQTNSTHTERYEYDATDHITHVYINEGAGEKLRAEKIYDAVGNVVDYMEYRAATGSSPYSWHTYGYDKDSKLETDNAHEGLPSGDEDIIYTLDVAGNVLKSVMTAHPDAITGNDHTTITTNYAYEYWDTAKQKSVSVQASNNGIYWGNWKPGSSVFTYDSNGHEQSVVDDFSTSGENDKRVLNYVTNHYGQILQRKEQFNLQPERTHYYYFMTGRPVGDVGYESVGPTSNGLDYAQILAIKQTPDYTDPGPVTSADFDQNFQPVTPDYPGNTPGYYTVRDGDKLETIALSLWGDSSLWHVLADANGVKGDAELVVGMNLIIPNVVTNFHNNSTTFRPYNPGAAIGDTNPTLPSIPEPPFVKNVTRSHQMMHNIRIMKHMDKFGLLGQEGRDQIPDMERQYHEMRRAEKKGKCGGFGQFLIMVAAIVVTAVVFPQAVGHVGQALLSAGLPMGVAQAGALVIGGAIAGAAGSIAGQGLGVATGAQSSFSWKAVGQAAIGNAITAGVGYGVGGTGLSGSGFGLGLGKTVANGLGFTSRFATGFTNGVLNSALSQGVNVVLGLQRKFDWRGVAATGFAGGVNSTLTNTSQVDPRTGEFVPRFNTRNPGTHLAQGLATGAIRDGSQVLFKAQDRIQWGSIAGNAVGNTVVQGLAGGFPSGPGQTDEQSGRVLTLDPTTGQFLDQFGNVVDTGNLVTAIGPLPAGQLADQDSKSDVVEIRMGEHPEEINVDMDLSDAQPGQERFGQEVRIVSIFEEDGVVTGGILDLAPVRENELAPIKAKLTGLEAELDSLMVARRNIKVDPREEQPLLIAAGEFGLQIEGTNFKFRLKGSNASGLTATMGNNAIGLDSQGRVELRADDVVKAKVPTVSENAELRVDLGPVAMEGGALLAGFGKKGIDTPIGDASARVEVGVNVMEFAHRVAEPARVPLVKISVLFAIQAEIKDVQLRIHAVENEIQSFGPLPPPMRVNFTMPGARN